MEKLTALTVAETMRRLGAWELTVDEAAEMTRPAYEDAAAAHATRTAVSNELDPDAASTPDAFVEVAAARQAGVITGGQYAALAGALQRTTRPRPSDLRL